MSCDQGNIKLRHSQQHQRFSQQYLALHNSLLVPVFCVCMIAAMGITGGVHQAVFMQFAVDANTEYIKLEGSAYHHIQQLNIEKPLI